MNEFLNNMWLTNAPGYIQIPVGAFIGILIGLFIMGVFIFKRRFMIS